MLRSELVVAGHICLDIAPKFNQNQSFEEVFSPGRLSLVGSADFSTGGAVANTGLAAHKLGLDTVLMGKIGADSFGRIIQERLSSFGARVVMSVSQEIASSYTIVLNLAGFDRIFLHHSGANDFFYTGDIDAAVVKESKLFHFGYPPLMKSIYMDNGNELEKIMLKVKQLGVATSLDMAMPDPNTESGRVDWEEILKRTAPYIDIFLPSYEELYLMLAREEYLKWRSTDSGRELSEQADLMLVREFADSLQKYGMGIIVIKVGKNGIYLRTPDLKRLQSFRSITFEPNWANRELWAESCKPEIFVSSTGAGDCAIAGLLTAILRGCPPEDAVQLAAIAGYQNLHSIDAISGLSNWEGLNRVFRSERLEYNELDLGEFSFRRIKKGLWSLDFFP